MMFLRICLESAEPVDGFCAGVPPTSDVVESTTWALRECGLSNPAGSRCTRQMQAKQGYCEGRDR